MASVWVIVAFLSIVSPGMNLAEDVQPSYTFGGNGYIILNKGVFRPSKTSLVVLKLKTFAENGLIFLMGLPSSSDYLSIELKAGKLVYQFDLGSGRVEMTSQQRINDGLWHTISTNRLNRDGILKIDSVTVDSARSLENMKELDTDDFIYIGGHKGNHTFASVTKVPFVGCIERVQLGARSRNMEENVEAVNVVQGCSLDTAPTTPKIDEDEHYPDKPRIGGIVAGAGSANVTIVTSSKNPPENIGSRFRVEFIKNSKKGDKHSWTRIDIDVRCYPESWVIVTNLTPGGKYTFRIVASNEIAGYTTEISSDDVTIIIGNDTVTSTRPKLRPSPRSTKARGRATPRPTTWGSIQNRGRSGARSYIRVG